MSILFCFFVVLMTSSSSLKVLYFLLDHTSSKTTISWSFHNIMYISLLGELSECKKFSALTSDKDFFTRDVAMTYSQSHYREVLRWEIFMEQELKFGLDLGRLAVLKKRSGPIMSNF